MHYNGEREREREREKTRVFTVLYYFQLKLFNDIDSYIKYGSVVTRV